MEEADLEAGLRNESVDAGEKSARNLVSGVGSVNGSFVVRFPREPADEVRPLLQTCTESHEDQEEHVFRSQSGILKSVKDKNKSKRPPRPPKGPALDAYDLKLIRELSELALERRMRIERIKDFKKRRASKAAESSSSASFGLIVTVLFCLIILFQGVCSRSDSVVKSHTSLGPVSSRRGEELLSVQVFKNLSPNDYDNGGSSEARKSNPVLKEGPTRDAG